VQNILSTIRLKSRAEVNIYSWKANHSFNWHQLIPAVSVFCRCKLYNEKQPLLFFSLCQYFTKAMLISKNHLGDGTWVFVTNIIADYIATDYLVTVMY
jgi:hypothetical protein